MTKLFRLNVSPIAEFSTNPKIEKSLLSLSFFFLIVPCALLGIGCGKKAKTEIGFKPHVLPMKFVCSRQNDGVWKVGGGLVTQYGIFSLEQTFDMRDEYTYLVLRDRAKGIDQVFKLGVKGYVEIHTQGEHKLRLQRDENKVVVDVETVSGNFDINVYPDSEAIARIELGGGQPDLVVFTDRRLAVEYDSIFWADDSLPLDSIKSVTLQKGLYSRSYVFNWKDDVKDRTAPFVLELSDTKTAEDNFRALEKILGANAPHIRSEQATRKSVILLLLFVSGFFGITSIVGLWMIVDGFSGSNKGRGIIGCSLCLTAFFVFIIPLIILAGDIDAVKSVFM